MIIELKTSVTFAIDDRHEVFVPAGSRVNYGSFRQGDGFVHYFYVWHCPTGVTRKYEVHLPKGSNPDWI